MSVVCDAVPPSEPASGLQRSRPTGAPCAKVEKEKRKRSRVTPEQLVHLERFFAMDRSPTAARRKEISDMLGMQERQTQIWFQNRRAKAKTQETKKGRGSSLESTPDTPPPLVTGYEAELHNLLHEDEPVTIIPCADLSVGTWRRIATTPRKHDLVAYLSDTKRCLTWFIHSSGFGFKMEIPFDTILNTEFTNAAPGSGLASFFLSQPPKFYMQSSRDAEPVRYWKTCPDWTEDQQATKVLRHDLVGSAVQLAHVLRHLNAHTSGSDIQLHSPTYHSQEQSSSALDLQPPPLATFTGSGLSYHPQNSVDFHQPDHLILAHKQPPVASHQLSFPDDPLHLPLERSTSGVIPKPDLPIFPQYSQPPSNDVNHPILYSSNSEANLTHHVSPSSLSANGSSSRSFSPLDSHQRPYSAGSAPLLPYDHNRRNLSFPHRFQSLGSDAASPSPPLLTTPFYPVGPVSNISTIHHYDPAIPVISGMPGMSPSDSDT